MVSVFGRREKEEARGTSEKKNCILENVHDATRKQQQQRQQQTRVPLKRAANVLRHFLCSKTTPPFASVVLVFSPSFISSLSLSICESSVSASSFLHAGAVSFSVSFNTLNFERSCLQWRFLKKNATDNSTARLL